MNSANMDRPRPRQDRSHQTYERILEVTGALLADVGIDAISTNIICARAGITPPALYRYFKDKYALIEALAQRLLDQQQMVVGAWVTVHAPSGVPALAAHVEPLLRELAGVTAAQPGAIWVYRAMRAVPRMSAVRLASHDRVTEQLSAVYTRLMPNVPAATIRTRVRLCVEFSYATDEMIAESSSADMDAVFYEAGRMLGSLFWFEEHPRT